MSKLVEKSFSTATPDYINHSVFSAILETTRHATLDVPMASVADSGAGFLIRNLMFRWFTRKPKDCVPSYSQLKAVRSFGLPKDLADREASPDHKQMRNRIEQELFAQESNEDAPNFITFLKGGQGLMHLRLPEPEGGCLLAFSSPYRAADYAGVHAPRQTFQYFCSSASQCVLVVREFREHAGIKRIALDRCPRCDILHSIDADSLDSAARVIGWWRISKATEPARSQLYCDYARDAASNGDFLTARDVALELVGHVTAEDPRSHLLLGKLAIQLRDKRLFGEAEQFLSYLKQDWTIERLRSAARNGIVSF